MAASRTNAITGTSALATTTATFGFTATAGRLLVLTVAADDYKTGNPSGYTLSTGMSQEGFLGHYLFWKVAAGSEINAAYTIGSASSSAWTVEEWSGLEASPYDVSDGTITTSGGDSQTTPTLTPSTGPRLILASIGGSSSDDFTGIGSWTSSYVARSFAMNNTAATNDITGVASLEMTGNGVTTTGTSATYTNSAGPPTANGHRTALIVSFKVASAVATCPLGLLQTQQIGAFNNVRVRYGS